ncbi:site-specific DNA-methyltransferase [Confluentibacter flavum]|uniref:site-specific DNA-methyltransferase (adenine-specific) n=1 Tax=Confluentibacter flavum TaxID=1909700 RepID=A0A2N3HLH3_9FLAO|nr:site-specific DNA-methyltransferase [Confluentibacter flavum]PKQ45806.1 type III restriction endonuclease subunit M [Confluentibacter flavum]
MPTLNWIGKEKVVSHHQDVPYRVLEHKYGFTADPSAGLGREHTEPINSGNKIIHGDNLEALKSLLPEYEGKIKCIYIDPPYNTGNESWVYNDNVNHPKIKKWLGEVVGKDGEDLTRHDKWLCMMYPRLKLLHKLLADDGAIFISIDDNEQANLKLICDEIFGARNFVTNLIWRSADSSNNDAKQFSIDYNHTLIYSKDFGWQPYKLERTEDNNAHYKNPDNDPNGPWFMGNLSSPNPRPNLTYILVSPNGTLIKPPKNGWRWSKERMEEMIESKEVIFSSDQSKIIKKTYLKDQSGIVPSNIWWDLEDSGHNRNAKYELIKIFNELKTSDIFKTPKPTKFVEKILKISSNKNSIILDSFAGSATTAHAVLNLNKQDGGNRKFIVIEMEDYANDVTAERVKRVAKGYGSPPTPEGGEKNKKWVEGTGGSFDFYELGLALFDENQNLNEHVGLEKIREYIWFSETRTSFTEPNGENYFLGKKDESAYYFIYEKDRLTTLDYDSLELIKTKGEQYVIYADNCLLPKEFMAKKNIIFKKIPRDITRF